VDLVVKAAAYPHEHALCVTFFTIDFSQEAYSLEQLTRRRLSAHIPFMNRRFHWGFDHVRVKFMRNVPSLVFFARAVKDEHLSRFNTATRRDVVA